VFKTIQKTAELYPDLIILDVNMVDRNHIAPGSETFAKRRKNSSD
jgi:hypothetical protein